MNFLPEILSGVGCQTRSRRHLNSIFNYHLVHIASWYEWKLVTFSANPWPSGLPVY